MKVFGLKITKLDSLLGYNQIMTKPQSKTILITGGTGFVGQHLVPRLVKAGYHVRLLARNPAKAHKLFPLPVEVIQWDALKDEIPPHAISGAPIIINLIGEGIADKRWNPERKKLLRESRLVPTQKLAEALNKDGLVSPKVISASAIGIYEDRGEEELHEGSKAATGYLGELCQKWEELGANIPAQRHALLRIGIVLGQDGGALKSMLPAFRAGVGGKLGNGKQWMSWIHVEDLCGLIMESITNDALSGAINAVAPTPVRNTEFTHSIGKSLDRLTIIPAPTLAIQMLFGELSKVMLSSQKVLAKKALEAGFEFQYPTIDEALEDILKPQGVVGAYRLKTYQWFDREQAEVFNFFSEARNLEKITPPWLNFKVLNSSTPKIEKGTLFDYRIKLHGVPMGWRTLIESWTPGWHFVDTQLKGPYKLWHHTHEFETLGDGTWVEDNVVYKLPFGRLGELTREFWVKFDLEKIFQHRKTVLSEVFPRKTNPKTSHIALLTDNEISPANSSS